MAEKQEEKYTAQNTQEQDNLHNTDAKEEQTVSAEETTETTTDVEAETSQPDPLEEAQRQLEEMKDRYLRCAAEFDNYKKRTLKEKTELLLNGGERTITTLLPVLDDLERALADKGEDHQAWREGVEMIYHKFVKTLESMGVRKIEAIDTDFNTDLHEAVAMVPGMGEDRKGKVIDCLTTGYTLNDKVIRHAKVAVAE